MIPSQQMTCHETVAGTSKTEKSSEVEPTEVIYTTGREETEAHTTEAGWGRWKMHLEDNVC